MNDVIAIYDFVASRALLKNRGSFNHDIVAALVGFHLNLCNLLVGRLIVVVDLGGLDLGLLDSLEADVTHLLGSFLKRSTDFGQKLFKRNSLAGFDSQLTTVNLPIVDRIISRSSNLRNSAAVVDVVIGSWITLESNMNFRSISLRQTFCKRCKRYAHDNHEHGSQQSQQTSFKSRFLHVISPIH